MDPLSISMSILTVIGATSSTIKAAKSIYNAPEEVDSLLNDLSDAELMIRDIKSYTEAHDGKRTSPQEQALQDRLTAAESIVVQLRDLVSHVVTKSSDAARRIAWLKAKKKTRRLSKKLARIHDDLPRWHGHAEGNRITLGLRDISTVQTDMSLGLSRLENHVQSTSKNVSQLREALISSQRVQDQTVSSIEDLRENTSERLHRLESAVLNSNDLLQRLPEILTLQIQTSQQVSTLTSSTRALIESSTTRYSETSTNTTSTIQSTYQSIMIRSQYRPPNSCELACPCSCHLLQSLSSPSFLNKLLGGIFVGYKGLPSLAKKCTDSKCRRDSIPKVYLTYFFPQWWIIDRMIILIAQWTFSRGPELFLRFPRRVGMNSAVFNLAEAGNIEGLKLLFNSGKASPNDVDPNNLGVLYHAFMTKYNLNAVKFLIQAGADTQAEDNTGLTFEERACMMAFTKSSPPEWIQWAVEDFVCRNESGFGFSSIHEVLLGLRYTSLQEEISRSSSTPGLIDRPDNFGEPPIHWAVSLGDLEAIRQLLKSGANPDIANKVGITPLHRGAKSRQIDCCLELLHNGANPHISTLTGWTILQYVCAYGIYPRSKSNFDPQTEARCIEFLNTLFNKGIDVNAKNKYGWNSLFYSLQAADKSGNLTLHWLLDHDVDYKINVSEGRTVLHQAGMDADLETLKLLREAILSGIDVHARLHDTGLTAMDCMRDSDRFIPASEELMKSFQQLLDEIEYRTNGQIRSRPENSENTILSKNHLPIFEEPLVSSETLDNCDQDSDSEDDVIFQDSVEYHVPESQARPGLCELPDYVATEI